MCVCTYIHIRMTACAQTYITWLYICYSRLIWMCFRDVRMPVFLRGLLAYGFDLRGRAEDGEILCPEPSLVTIPPLSSSIQKQETTNRTSYAGSKGNSTSWQLGVSKHVSQGRCLPFAPSIRHDVKFPMHPARSLYRRLYSSSILAHAVDSTHSR